jgi:uncharacterized membrane protein YfhO
MDALTTHSAPVQGGPVRHAIVNAVGPPILLAVVIIGVFWKITLTNQFTWLESPDLAYQVLPWQQVQVQAFHHHQFPLWDPYLWGGQTLIGQVQPGTAYPLNWIVYALPVARDGFIRGSYLNWYFALIHWLAALFCYWLCRDLELSRMASLIGGTAFALAGVVGTTDWPQILNGMIWMPLVLLFLLRAVRGRRPLLSAALSGFFLGISWLAGHHQVPIYFSLAIAGVWAFYFFRGNKLNWHVARLAAVSVVFVIFTSALLVLPAYEYGHLSRRWAGAPEPIGWDQAVPYSVVHDTSLQLRTIFGLLIPGVHGFADPYTGVILLSLAALAVTLCWQQVRVRILCVFALAGLFISLGYQSVFHGLLYAVVPMVEKAREPAMAIALFNFGVAVLVAYGFDSLRAVSSTVWPRRIALWLACTGVVLLILTLGVMLSKKMAFDYDDRVILVALLALLVAALYLAYLKGNLSITSLGVCCFLLLLLDMGNSAVYGFAHELDPNHTLLKKYSENQDILQWIRRQPGPFRIQVDSKDIAFNYGDWYGLDVFGGYLTSLPINLTRLGWGDQRVRMLYGTRYWISRTPLDADQVEVYTGSSGVKIYVSPTAFPRVWTVHRAMTLASEDKVRPTAEDGSYDLRHTAFFLGDAPKLSVCPGDDQAALVHSEFNQVVIKAEMQCQGLVVLSDNWYPGWTATVDGQPARIWEAYTVIRGIEVPAGSHRIEMRYRPRTVTLGAWMLAFSVAGLVALAWLSRSR